MSLRFALLGFLDTAPASGFEIAREFGESIGWFWHASHSQIYPELRRLENEELIEGVEVAGGPGKRKRVYSLLPAGREQLRAWLEEPTQYAPVRDVERVKLMFLDDAPISAIRSHLEDHVVYYQDLLEAYSAQALELHAGTFPRLVKRVASRTSTEPELIKGMKLIAMQGNIARARTEIAWAKDALVWLAGWEERA